MVQVFPKLVERAKMQFEGLLPAEKAQQVFMVFIMV